MQTIKTFERTRGEEHLLTQATVHNLGVLCHGQGMLQEAERLYMQALKGCKKGHAENYQLRLDTTQCLGTIYSVQGNLAKAESILIQTLEGYVKALGAEHPLTLRAKKVSVSCPGGRGDWVTQYRG
jgi:hypothetical protein